MTLLSRGGPARRRFGLNSEDEMEPNNQHKEYIKEIIEIARKHRLAGYANEFADTRLVSIASDAMQNKLALCREKGRGGWWDDKDCSIDHLRDLLKSHVEKGDMVDVMNLAAMIYVREIADAPWEEEGTQ